VKSVITNVCIVVVSIVVAAGLGVAMLEGVLRGGGLKSGGVPWIAPEDAARDAEIDKVSGALAALHPFSFTDLIHAGLGSNETGYRVAVLSDSFVWGDGLLPGQPWPHKLQRKLRDSGANVSVQSWGVNGWSTRDQLTFLKALKRDHGSLDIDEALIGFVTNDLDMGDIEQRQTPKIPIPIPYFSDWFPLADAFLTAHLQGVYERVIDPGAGYGSWEAALWTEGNLESYRSVLTELRAFSLENDLPITFVLTPHRPEAAFFAPKYQALKTLLADVGLPVIDLLPAVMDQLVEAGTPPLYRELWANPGDGHPGDPLTNVYAEEVAAVLRTRGTDRATASPVLAVAQQPCDVGQITAVIPQPVQFNFGPESYLRLVGTVSYSGGTEEESASRASVHWPGGQSTVYQRDVLAGDAPRVYDRANSARTEPASKFWADVPAAADFSALSLRVGTMAGCFYVAPLELQAPPVNLTDRG
jgi:hypothetical protein